MATVNSQANFETNLSCGCAENGDFRFDCCENGYMCTSTFGQQTKALKDFESDSILDTCSECRIRLLLSLFKPKQTIDDRTKEQYRKVMGIWMFFPFDIPSMVQLWTGLLSFCTRVHLAGVDWSNPHNCAGC
ncbi:unnamed protein product [Kuraishia capsulata CBS 1993]|uniref:Uncharacterized protein n=1 Tax=Kuraishia capsulata CBS 1993 TaxID=1382522 RepID=W6MPA5_9ASCO|nr:uncharacterized protein KUCA_T00004104001 [Kuraishia capsulata CBS 1993]CDK28123.1 unnamed protein product [Kuraishia capsulata CBS 1993]